MTNLKAYKEKQNEIVEKMQLILDSAQLETRALKEEEKTEYEKLKAELKALKETIKLLQEELQEKPMTEEEGKEEMKEQRNLRKELLSGEKVFIKGEQRNLQANQNPGAKAVAQEMDGNVLPLKTHNSSLISRIPFTVVDKNVGSMTFIKETELGTLPDFVDENTPVEDTDAVLDSVTVSFGRIPTSTTISKKLAMSAAINLEDYTTDMLSRRLERGLSKTVIKGKELGGVKVFDGLEGATKSQAVTVRTGGVLEIADFIETLNAMHIEHQAGAVWIMSKNTFNMVSKLQDSNGNYYMLRQLNPVDNKPQYMLLGCEILISDDIKGTLATETDVVYLVNFENAYKGLMAESLEISANEFEAQKRAGNILFLADLYCGARIYDTSAIVKLKGKVA